MKRLPAVTQRVTVPRRKRLFEWLDLAVTGPLR